MVKKGLRRDDGEGKHMLAFPPHFPESFVEKKRFTEPCAELGNSAIAEELDGKAEQKTEQTRNISTFRMKSKLPTPWATTPT